MKERLEELKTPIIISSAAIGLYAIAFSAFPKHMRKMIGKAQDWKCQHDGCDRSFADGWMVEVDHIVSEAKGGTHDFINGQVLCRFHHMVKHLQDGEIGAANLIKSRIEKLGEHNIHWKGK